MCPPTEPHNRIKDYLPPITSPEAAPVSEPPPPKEEPYPWRGFWPRIIALLRQRCPRCCQGKIFGGFFRMNDPCPVCGLVFQREEGYFLGAMYVSYLLGSVLAGLFYWAVYTWDPDLGPTPFALLFFLVYLPLTPFIWRYSRTGWIHFERWACPSDASATAFEKDRVRRWKQENDQQRTKDEG
jgi:uncharacterized protein (DUF983 family)